MPLKIILDTNFLMIPGIYKKDIFSEIKKSYGNAELYVLQGSIDELHKIIREQKGSDKAAAKLAIQLLTQKLKTKTINIIDYAPNNNVDDALVELSKSYIIATQDKELKSRLKGKKLIFRQKSYFEIIG